MPFNGPIEDKLEIHELVMVYGDAVTRKNSKDWGSTWEESAIWSVPNGLEKVEGRKEIVKKWEETMENYEYIVFTVHSRFFKYQRKYCLRNNIYNRS